MRPLIVFYHCRLVGHPTHPIDTDHAINLMNHQMRSLEVSGLVNACSRLFIGINGNESDADMARIIAPEKAEFFVHGSEAISEIPTMEILREYVHTSPDCYVLYHHIKGVTHPGQAAFDNWRQRLENICVWGWRECVHQLERGIDSAGGHWLTPEQYPGMVSSPFWGGTFWWTKSEYLKRLPELPAASWENRYHAEGWIGLGRPYPTVADFYPGWP